MAMNTWSSEHHRSHVTPCEHLVEMVQYAEESSRSACVNVEAGANPKAAIQVSHNRGDRHWNWCGRRRRYVIMLALVFNAKSTQEKNPPAGLRESKVFRGHAKVKLHGRNCIELEGDLLAH